MQKLRDILDVAIACNKSLSLNGDILNRVVVRGADIGSTRPVSIYYILGRVVPSGAVIARNIPIT